MSSESCEGLLWSCRTVLHRALLESAPVRVFMGERLPSRTLFPGPLAGSLTRGVFAWSGNSGRMTRLVVVHGEGADRAPLREVFFFFSPPVLRRAVTHDRFDPLVSRRNLFRLTAFPFFASLCIVVQSSLSEEPETLSTSLVRAPSSGALPPISQ